MKSNDEFVNPLAVDRAAWNHYRQAFRLLRDRLRWDLSGESHRSRRKISGFKDKYSGEKAVIVCNGPSLLKTDFSLLDGVHSFGLNKINLLFERSDFRPSFVVAVNRLVLEQNSEFYNKTDIPLFLDYQSRGWVESRDNVSFLFPAPFLSFARDCSMGVYQGYTVTYVALQLAFHMGFREVALVGCDHTFASKGPANKTVVSGAHDASHFDPRYFSGGVQWQLPDLLQSEISYALARDVYAAHGGRVVNATEGGELEVFERMSLQEFLEEK